MSDRGAFYKHKTRRWFESRGWHVADLEVVHWIHPPDREPLAVKRDQMGADLLLVGFERIVFVQVKGGKQALGGGTFPEARRTFAKCYCPSFAEQVIVAWVPGAQVPRIIDAREEITHGETIEESTGGQKAGNAPQHRSHEAKSCGTSARSDAPHQRGHAGAIGSEGFDAVLCAGGDEPPPEPPAGSARAAVAWCRRGPRHHRAR